MKNIDVYDGAKDDVNQIDMVRVNVVYYEAK
jgi:hypothetical protein